MTMNRTTMQEKGVRAYVQWREASLRANVAYRAWASEAGSRDRAAFGLYLTALDAEEHAAEVYAELVRSADRLSALRLPTAAVNRTRTPRRRRGRVMPAAARVDCHASDPAIGSERRG